ncbi:MAG: 3-phosphoshikimate 1-carboxyvinyltransferase [Fimbriimonas ginsengisoli]|uniref:3-phosphoshikimate 1-carboxyvinyltransferase n=1 Tax=Fimbriimonas ginsengisoli TaxID=1005039 RepID=A0A931LTA5_FIMGI|nr:3-phosphoshikimate 1-carboxyvinyltransferase [Fimbriimonas ginsengisoli]
MKRTKPCARATSPNTAKSRSGCGRSSRAWRASKLGSVEFRISRAARIEGSLRPPSDKSITHRAYLFGSIASGPCVVRQPLEAEDCESTLACLARLGLTCERSAGEVRLIPATAWRAPEGDLECGNSGTTMRLLAGLVAARPIQAVMTGDASLSRRPMGRIAEPLRQMGALVVGDQPPLWIRGGGLKGIRYASPVASAQVKSCVLLAGLDAEGETWVSEPSPSRDHTERMLRACGVPVLASAADGVGVRGGSKIGAFEIRVPGDLSSAAFWLVAASLVPNSVLTLPEVGVNPTRSGVLDVLSRAGGSVEEAEIRAELGEPVANLKVRTAPSLSAFHIGADEVPRLIDEIPVLAVLATQCEGTSEIREAAELRTKESDRIAAMAAGLRAMGAEVETFEDGMAIQGPVPLRGTRLDCKGDHRIAMALAVAGLVADGETCIDGWECVRTSYPDFERDLRSIAVL